MFLAVDPGRHKCGWALVKDDGEIVARGIWLRAEVPSRFEALAQTHPIDPVVMGDRTGHQDLLRDLAACRAWNGRVVLIGEDRSSEEARRRCVRETARGWQRLLPASLRYPREPYDDFVAVILAERYLNGLRG